MQEALFDPGPPARLAPRLSAQVREGGEPTVEQEPSAPEDQDAVSDVLDILHKKRQIVTSYRVEVDGDRPPPGEYPRPFSAIRVRHIVSGENLDPIAVARAVELSDTKYCTVITTIRGTPEVTSTWEIEKA